MTTLRSSLARELPSQIPHEDKPTLKQVMNDLGRIINLPNEC